MFNVIKMLLILSIFVIFFILSIVLFVKRNKIIAKYGVGYISSFLFASYMLAPVLMGISALISPEGFNDTEVHAGVFFIYPIIGISIFLFVYRNMTTEYKTGKFFAMLGIGICAGYMLIFRMLKIINFFESNKTSSAESKQASGPIPNVQHSPDGFRSRINEYGEIYDYGGKLLARINENNDIILPNGNYYAHMDYAGDVYDANGKYLGRIKDKEIQNSKKEYTGRLYND